jgi:hypothetical protein
MLYRKSKINKLNGPVYYWSVFGYQLSCLETGKNLINEEENILVDIDYFPRNGFFQYVIFT